MHCNNSLIISPAATVPCYTMTPNIPENLFKLTTSSLETFFVLPCINTAGGHHKPVAYINLGRRWKLKIYNLAKDSPPYLTLTPPAQIPEINFFYYSIPGIIMKEFIHTELKEIMLDKY